MRIAMTRHMPGRHCFAIFSGGVMKLEAKAVVKSMATTNQGGKPKSKLDQLIAQGKRPEDLSEEEKKQVLEEVDKEIENMTADDVIKAVERGEIQIEYVDPPNPIDNFT